MSSIRLMLDVPAYHLDGRDYPPSRSSALVMERPMIGENIELEQGTVTVVSIIHRVSNPLVPHVITQWVQRPGSRSRHGA